MLCHCKSQKEYANCCGLILQGKCKAATAEQLMRSRYSAFVVADINYLMSSHHFSTRPTKEKQEILKWTQSVSWLGLQIVCKKAGAEDDHEGWVEFKATYMHNSRLECIYENSYFVKEEGQWFYKSGVHR